MLQRVAPQQNPGQPPPARPLPSKRRPVMLAVSVALTALGALAAWEVYGIASDHTPVLVVARDVPIGQQLQAQDLRTVAMGMDPGVPSFNAHDKGAVIGKRAAVELKANGLLAPSQVTDGFAPAPGEQVVPIAVKTSQLPARGIQPGDPVLAVTVPTDGTRTPAIHPGRVDRVGQPDADGLVVVDLVVPAADGPALAQQAAVGKVAIVLQSRAG
ncbi:SAF domain-containing protein [Nonomuraea insulae]|uniref:SAF domain-containing protein n=1 Tax=Nonomuraea insulae TaxID=1616787 RepID=A0ABW1CW83_9ACTN